MDPWLTRLAALTAARDVTRYAGHLRALTGVPHGGPVDLALHLAETRGGIAARIADRYRQACGTYLGAATALAEVDPAVDVRPLVEGR